MKWTLPLDVGGLCLMVIPLKGSSRSIVAMTLASPPKESKASRTGAFLSVVIQFTEQHNWPFQVPLPSELQQSPSIQCPSQCR